MFLFGGYPILGLGIYNHKVGYPKKGYGTNLQVMANSAIAHFPGKSIQ